MVLVFILLSLPQLAFPQRRILEPPQYYVKTTKLECNSNPEWIVNVTCKLKPINWERTLANLSGDLKQPFRNISLNVQVFRLETRYVPFLINVTKNLCELFHYKKMDFYARIGLAFLKRFTDNKHPACPVTGHIEGTNIIFDLKYARYIIPPGIYQMIFIATEGYPSQSVGNITVTGIVAEKFKKFE